MSADTTPDAVAAAERWRVVADGFTARVDGVPADRWDAPAPCEGWVARDIVVHLVEWVPSLLAAGADVDFGPLPDPAADPVGAWGALRSGIDTVLADPEVGERRFSHPQAGDHALPDAIGTFVTPDVFVHTWDLARATGQDERLDPAIVDESVAGLSALAPDFLASTGQYGPRVPVPDDADPQTRLLALLGRRA
jgi:uncharacterized protein (TIGR03086 family)